MTHLKYLIFALFLSIIPFTQSNANDSIFKDTTGQITPTSKLKGKWIFINYWASWCQTCLDEIPQLNRFYKRHKKDSVILFGVNYDALSLYEQNKLIKKLHIKYPNLAADPAYALHLGNIRGVPATFIFNPKGQLVKTIYGGISTKMLERIIHSK